MHSPAVKPFAPSTQPALELIALAQLSPEQARQKLRALLLANPNYFGKVPSTSFNAVLNIQEDTTYECISRIAYDSEWEQLRATIDIKQPFGYSCDALIHGSEEFVRFYLSYDGGSKWLDQGMRSLSVFDAHLARPVLHEVSLQIVPAEGFCSEKLPPKVRAILSWNSPPPAGAPNWTPVWGNVVESDLEIEDSQVDFPGISHSSAKAAFRNAAPYVMQVQSSMQSVSAVREGHLQSPTLHCTSTDPQHRFLAFVLARAAGYETSRSEDPGVNLSGAVRCDAASSAFPPGHSVETTVAAV